MIRDDDGCTGMPPGSRSGTRPARDSAGRRRHPATAVSCALAGAALAFGGCQDSPTRAGDGPAVGEDVAVWEWDTDIPGEVSAATSDASIQAIAPDTRPGAVLPSAFASQLALSGNILPFGWPNFFAWPSIRYQQVFLGAELGTRRFFDELCIRLTSTSAGLRIVTLKLSATTVDHTNMSTTFAANYGTAPVTVVDQTQVTIAAETGGGVDDYYPCLPFSEVYVHPGGNLLVEFQIWPVGSGDLDNRPFMQHDACYSLVESGCTTRRLWGIHANASSGSMDADQLGLVMKLIEASAADALRGFIDRIVGLELNRGIEASLSGPLEQALSSLENDRPAALQQLGAFIVHVEGIRGSLLTDEEADELIAIARSLIDAIEAGG